jgi:hypothetical protein
MTLERLDNLVRTGQVHQEPPDQAEIAGLLKLARTWLADCQIAGVSEEGQFMMAYDAAHSLALAAMRWHGNRSDKRYLVFQCLEHTVGLSKPKWRVLDKCHQRRNLSAYEGVSDVDSQLLEELIEISNELLELVEALGGVT